MNPIKKFDKWVNEDFATVANTPGMGDVTPPTSTSNGSGDTWPSLGAPSTQTGSAKKKKKRKKRKSKKIDESDSELKPEETIEVFDDALIGGAAQDTSISDRDWTQYFDDFYGCSSVLWLSPKLKKELRALFAELKYQFWLEFNHYDEHEDLSAITKDGWTLFTSYEEQGANSSFITRIFYKPYTEQEMKDNYDEILSDFKRKIPTLHKKSIEFIERFLTPEDIHTLRGKKGLSKYGV
jgi:hypothetical protein